MDGRSRAGSRAQYGGAARQPGQGDLPAARTVPLGDLGERLGRVPVSAAVGRRDRGRQARPWVSQIFSTGSDARSMR